MSSRSIPLAARWPLLAMAILVATGGAWSPVALSQVYHPDHPEVRAMVERGLTYLEESVEPRLGGRCLMGLAYYKAGQPNHRLIHEAIAACKEVTRMRPEKITDGDCDIYSTGIGIIFLSSIDPIQFRPEIKTLLQSLEFRQKPHGGWGYDYLETGDTSMTQYGVLSTWEAARAGVTIDPNSIAKVCDWLLRTQDRAGGWGYQGEIPQDNVLLEQREVRHSLSAAGLGSVYICASILGLSGGSAAGERRLPAVITPVGDAARRPATLRVDKKQLDRAQGAGNRWFKENYRIDPERYSHYYLYALERYHSFKDLAENREGKTASWYDDGVRYLAATQNSKGGWQSDCGAAADTSFAILFLLRSTKMAIDEVRTLGDGRLVGGRGLPSDTSNVDVRGGAVLRRQLAGPGEDLAKALRLENDGDLFYFSQNLSAFSSGVWKQVAGDRRLMLRTLDAGSPEARLVAVHALGSVRDLDNVPPLISALGDKDVRVAMEANEGLKFIARKVSGFELPDNASEADRTRLMDQWRDWYQGVRPATTIE